MTSQADEPQDTRSLDEIEESLARTRQELGETFEALAGKLDVKSRSRHWARRTSMDARVKVGRVVHERGRELAIAGGAAGLVLLTVAWWARR